MKLVLKYTLTVNLAFLAATVFGQEKKAEPQAVTEEIEVVRPYKPVLADAVKIRRSPDLNTNEPFKPSLSYNILDKKLELNTDIRELKAQKLADEKPALLRNHYAKVGVGNLNTGLAEIYLNTGDDEALQAGFFAKHLSQSGGDLSKQQLSNQQFGLFGRSIADNLTYAGRLTFDRRSTYFYGLNSALPAPSADPGKQRFNTLEAEGELYNNYSEASDKLNYGLKLNGYMFGNISEGRENSLALTGYFNKAFNNFNFGFNASADFTGAKDELYSLGNHILRGNPYVKFRGNGFLLNVGLNIANEFGDRNRTNVFPSASIEVPIATEYAIIFGGVKGDVVKTSLKELTYENPFLDNNIALMNAVEKTNVYGGIKGNAGSGFGFRMMAYLKKTDNMPLFVNNPGTPSRFLMTYDGGESKVAGIEGELSIKASDVFTLTGKAQANHYDMATEEEAWFKPGLKVSGTGRLQVNKKLGFDAEVVYNGDSYAKVIDPLSSSQANEISRVKSFIDLSAGGEYRINNKLGTYLRVNNIFGTQYQQYLYYPKFGTNIFAGFNYSF
ncbi:MAG TPA: hypothetical protein VGE26_11720 [Sphingobacteriaceae bacterium]